MTGVGRYYLKIYHHDLAASNDDAWVDLSSLEIHPEMAGILADFGILETKNGCIEVKQAVRLSKLQRLRGSLGVNLSGAAIILDLLERIEAMQEEIDRLRRE